MRKPAICICENKDADQLRGNREADRDREADQRLCFRYLNSTIPVLLNTKFQASSHFQYLYSLVCVGPGQNQHCWFSRVAAHLIFRSTYSIHIIIGFCQLETDTMRITVFLAKMFEVDLFILQL